MSDTAPRRSRSRSPFSRTKDEGPRASFRQLLPYILEHRGVLVVVIVLSILAAAASLAQPLLISQVVGIVQKGGTLGRLVWAVVALVVVGGVISGFQHYLLQRMGTSVVLSARTRLVRRMLKLPIAQYDLRRTGDLVSRVGSDTTLLYAVMTQGLVDAVGGSIQFLGALVAMFILDPVLLGLTVLVIAVSIGVVGSLSGRVRRASRAQQEKVGAVAAAVERTIGAIRTVRAANATDREVAGVEKEAVGAWEAGIRVAKASAGIVPIATIAMNVSFLVVLGVGGYRVASGAIPISSLVAFILFLFLMIMPLGQAFGAVSSVNQGLGALGRIQEIIDLPEETDGDAAIEPAAPVVSTDAIRFDDVHFSYPEQAHRTEAEKLLAKELGESPATDRNVLRGVSFGVAHGKRTALVGPSGAGKSTILSLVERFYDPDAGVVRLDGVDIRGLERADLRSRIGYVEQDAPVLAGTIRENLTLNTPDADDAELVRVLHAVNLGRVLDRDPRGLDAEVGEEGIMLSGGERQRLAIARALVAAPPILLLDESTSSLDGVNEQLMREAIDAVAEGRTLLVIAHRLSTVVDSDEIVVLEDGAVIGRGTHSELVASTPLYRELAKHQLLV